MVQKIQSMFCPSCGAPIAFEDGREDTFCSHCGCQLIRDDDKIEIKMKHQEVMADIEREKARYEMLKHADDSADRQTILEWIGVGALIIFAIVYLTIIF